jgi:trehalose 6-phosphate synthase
MLDQAGTHLHRSGSEDDGKSRLIVVSNRAGVEHYVDEFGRIRRRNAAGGVAVALSQVAREEPVTWIAAAGGFADRVISIAGGRIDIGNESVLRLVDIPEDVYEPYYTVFSNPILWFVQHSLSDLLRDRDVEAEAQQAWRDGYLPANRLFAQAVIDEIEQTGSNRVMLHDYHFYAAPRMIRAACPEVTLQQFIHIPWPEPQEWRALPDATVRDICDGLLANDTVAFQTDEDVENFLATCRAYLGARAQVWERRGEVEYRGLSTTAWSNPISVDVADLESVGHSAEVIDYGESLDIRDESVIVRVDRLDPSKNVFRGFQAYWRLLERNPRMHGKVRFLAFLVPSRESIDEYSTYARETLELVDRLNQRFGTKEWEPVTIFHEQNRLQAFAGLARYDVLLVNSAADGMNLVCKEGAIINQRDGVIVLSETAGAYEQLRRGVLGVEPLDVEGTALALERALALSPKERASMAAELKQSIHGHQIHDWLRLLLRDLAIHDYIRNAGVSKG